MKFLLSVAMVMATPCTHGPGVTLCRFAASLIWHYDWNTVRTITVNAEYYNKVDGPLNLEHISDGLSYPTS